MRTTSDPTQPELPRQSLDLAFRALWKHRPDAVATVALGTSVLAVERRPATALIAERAPDGVATVLTAQGGCTLHVEFETSVRPAELPRRMAHAGWVLHGPREGLPVRSVALMLDPRPSLPRTYEMTHGQDVIGTYRFNAVALSDLDVEELLDAPAHQAGLLALVPLARGADSTHLERAAARLHALGSPDAHELAVVSLLLGTRRFEYADLVRIFREDFLKLGDAWTNIEKRGFEKGVRQGIERGIEQGIERGIEHGRKNAERAALRTVSSARFGAHLDDLIETMGDSSLDRALAAVAAAADVDAARAALLALAP